MPNLPKVGLTFFSVFIKGLVFWYNDGIVCLSVIFDEVMGV